jgi:hypothetical protein
MWSLRTRTAVFVPRVAEGSRIAHSQKLLETETRIRIRAAISRLALPGREGDQGARVTGSLTLHGPYAGVRFRKGGVGEPDLGSSPVEMGSALLPLSPIVPIPGTSVRVRSASPPYLWAQFVNACLDPLSSCYCLGRCDREAMRLEPTFEAPARLTAWLSARKVSRRSGPVLELSGELRVPDGIFLHLRTSAGCDRLGEPCDVLEVTEAVIVSPGATVDVPQRIVTAGTAGNPWVSIALRAAEAGPAESEIPVGRCVQLD